MSTVLVSLIAAMLTSATATAVTTSGTAVTATASPTECRNLASFYGSDWNCDICLDAGPDATAKAIMSFPQLMGEEDITWCVETSDSTECGSTGNHPWCRLDEYGDQCDDVACCILTILNGYCGCLQAH